MTKLEGVQTHLSNAPWHPLSFQKFLADCGIHGGNVVGVYFKFVLTTIPYCCAKPSQVMLAGGSHPEPSAKVPLQFEFDDSAKLMASKNMITCVRNDLSSVHMLAP